jgi:hypothetical protein
MKLAKQLCRVDIKLDGQSCQSDPMFSEKPFILRKRRKSRPKNRRILVGEYIIDLRHRRTGEGSKHNHPQCLRHNLARECATVMRTPEALVTPSNG